jgi:hypothetical protein
VDLSGVNSPPQKNQVRVVLRVRNGLDSLAAYGRDIPVACQGTGDCRMHVHQLAPSSVGRALIQPQ